MKNILIASFLVYSTIIVSSNLDITTDDLDEDDYERFKRPIYSTSISRATVRIILDFYTKVSSTLAITRSSAGSNSLEQFDFVSEVLYHIKGNICITNEDYSAVGDDRLRYFNAMFIDGYPAFR